MEFCESGGTFVKRTTTTPTVPALQPPNVARRVLDAGSARPLPSTEIKWRNGRLVAATFEGKFPDASRNDAGSGRSEVIGEGLNRRD